ncbi:MAG: winged helix-turn-helix transcriptional regulator [Polyangiaceae bacterium]|nr:winged helix-turn-helix transcriptional regulator [Myxococcales bacterium]MCB9590501.1 winged helix-turn-helix transcriptional regulator [Polyangiaceae bacterium]MCB9608494.1 winged helix-turn-helix transcriptional regulator [Polyangiaceae bacterium]
MFGHEQALNRTFAALADPTRRAILARLTVGEATVSELGAPFNLAQPTISKHLKVLVEAGLVERRRDAQFRRCRISGAHLEQAWAWLGDYRAFWEQSFDRLDAYAKRLQREELDRGE